MVQLAFQNKEVFHEGNTMILVDDVLFLVLSQIETAGVVVFQIEMKYLV